MVEVHRTDLPGIGFRAEIDSASGTKLGVLVHRSGRRDLLFYGPDDLDSPEISIELDEDEARTLAELLGGLHVSASAPKAMQLPGLVIDWLPVPTGSPLAGQTLSESGVRTRSGASIVAVRGKQGTIIAPGAEDRLHAGDTVVIVCDEIGLARFSELLRPT
jgi:TrkA domain protein